MMFMCIVRNTGILLLLFLCCAASQETLAQVKIGDNPTVINPNSVLELESTSKGLLLPRLNLVATDSFAPMTAFVPGMFVYNLNTSGVGSTAVTPGIYYCDGTRWVRAGTTNSSSTGILKEEYIATASQVNFATPASFTDIRNISVYRNGVNIKATMVNTDTVALEIACVAGDEIRIVQVL